MNISNKKAFTMIELIFVIVIIGILAAVAIPKLSATRDDARISNILTNARTALGDITADYTSQGQTAFIAATHTVKDVTNVSFETSCTVPVPDNTQIAGATLLLCDGAVECVRFDVDGNGTTLSVTATTSPTNTICRGVQSDPSMASIAGISSGVPKVHILGGINIIR